jgi:NAD(P)-dependent dehydrogenase (short-subunit alcohol dehydrogenase family)
VDLALDGKRALVTGGSRGIGRAIAHALAREGCAVVICARNAEALDAAAEHITRQGGARVAAIAADTSQAGDIERLIEGTVGALGGIDILVNNAAAVGGRGSADTLLEGDEAILHADFDTKVLGYVRTARLAASHMVEQGWGRIIQISGLATRVALGVSGGMRNAAVTNLGVTLANELGPHGITVNTLQPGAVETETLLDRLEGMARQQGVDVETFRERMASQNAIRRIVTGAEIANVVAFLASPLSGAINGESISVAGGTPNVYY